MKGMKRLYRKAGRKHADRKERQEGLLNGYTGRRRNEKTGEKEETIKGERSKGERENSRRRSKGKKEEGRETREDYDVDKPFKKVRKERKKKRRKE